MLTRRNFFVILMLFAVVFIMFMLVDISAGILTSGTSNPRADLPVLHANCEFLDEDAFRIAENTSEAALNASDSTKMAVADNPLAAIIAPVENDSVLVLQEWCVYNKYRYQVYREFPAASQLSECDVLLFTRDAAGESDPGLLMEYADLGADMVFVSLPEYARLAENPQLADFFGVSVCIQDDYALDGVCFLDEFFIGGERIYAIDDDYGDTDDDVHISIPYYELRPGYLLFAQAISPDKAIDYMDLPGLLWRTYTGKSNVYVCNTDIFTGKSLLGLITAFLSQSDEYMIYPVVNAQTISLVDYPLLAAENTDVLKSIYSRDAEALGRDVLWPGVAKILRNYGKSYNFFLSTQLDHSDSAIPSAEFIPFYRQEIERISGVMGLSMHHLCNTDEAEKVAQDAAFLSEAMPAYQFTTAYLTRDQLAKAAHDALTPPLSSVTLVMSDMVPDSRVLEASGDRAVTVSFTTDGFMHESMDDLQLVCMETALGMNNQKVEMHKAFYPENDLDWNALNLLWSRGDTYQKPFAAFDDVSVYELEDRVRTFLSLDYSANMSGNQIRLSVIGDVENASFILRLFNHEIEDVTGAEYTQLSETAYLLRPSSSEVLINVSDMHVITDAPTRVQEVTDR